MNPSDKTLNRNCPLCGSSTGELIHAMRFVSFDNDLFRNVSELVSCSQCGFIFNDIGHNQKEIDEYYEKHSFYSSAVATGGGGTTAFDLERYEETISFLKKHIPDKKGLILEVGCGKGGFLNALKKQGYNNLYAVDLEPNCVKFIEQEYGITARAGSAADLPFTELSADLLIYTHVFEHIHDLHQSVKEAEARLNPDGLLYIEVPDAARYSMFPVYPFYYLSLLEHINHFDAIHLNNLFAGDGFECIDSGTKSYHIARDSRFACIYFVFRKSQPAPIKHDFSLKQEMLHYIDAQQSELDSRCHSIKQLHQDRTPVYVWGISKELSCILAQTDLMKCNIKCFIDNNKEKQKMKLAGIPIFSQEKLKYAENNEAVVIASHIFKDDMNNFLKEIHFPGQIITIV